MSGRRAVRKWRKRERGEGEGGGEDGGVKLWRVEGEREGEKVRYESS
jgi:hypothetical protein